LFYYPRIRRSDDFFSNFKYSNLKFRSFWGRVRVSATNVCGVSAFKSKAVSLLTCDLVTPAQAETVQAEPGANKLDVKLWPNPARDVLMITLDGFEPGKKIELTLMEADGKVQTAQSLMPTICGQQVRMDVSRRAAGLYLLQVSQGTLTETKRVIILRSTNHYTRSFLKEAILPKKGVAFLLIQQ
jgi:Secretion system C-terminal sorting domain